MSRDLLERRLQNYPQDGFAFPIPVLAPQEVAGVLRAIDDISAECGGPLNRLPFTHGYFPWAFALATHAGLLDVVEGILGSDIVVWGTLILSKPARSRLMVSWHQDHAYASFLNGSPSLSAWIALTPSNSQSGCMRVIPKSQGPVLPFSEQQPADDMLRRGLRVLAEINEASAVDLELAPGEASLHEVSLLHGSNANTTDTPRIGFIVRYATPAMKQPGYPIYCVRGKAGNLQYAAPPVARPAAECLAAYAEYLKLGE